MENATRPFGRRVRGVRTATARAIIVPALGALVAALGIPAAANAVPTDMHWELVSPVNKNGQGIVVTGIAPDNNRVLLSPLPGAGFADAKLFSNLNNLLVAERASDGWKTTVLNPPATEVARMSGLDLTPDLGTALFTAEKDTQYQDGQQTLMLGGLDGSLANDGPVIDNHTGIHARLSVGVINFQGATPDLSHAVMSSDAAPLATDVPGRTGLYEMVDTGKASSVFRRVDVDSGGTVIGGAVGCSSTLGLRGGGVVPGNRGIISDDGSTVFFSARPAATAACIPSTMPAELYARINGSTTVRISASECTGGCSSATGDATFAGASPDGTKVYFLSPAQLVDGDTDATTDLYLYDFTKPAGSRLTQVSAGGGSDATPGSGAAVKGVPAISDDLSRAYIVSSDVLTTVANGLNQVANSGDNNLYVVGPNSSDTKFVAKLSNVAPEGPGLWRGGTGSTTHSVQLADPQGRYLLFSSFAQITASDTDATQDVYRYDADTGDIIKISPGNGVSGDADGYNAQIPRGRADGNTAAGRGLLAASTDASSVVFWTREPLDVANDENGTWDVYLWHDNTVEMVTDGKDLGGGGPASDSGVATGDSRSLDMPGATSAGIVSGSFGISPDGSMIAFNTVRHLAKEDTDGAADVYVARTGQDVTHQPDPLPGCDLQLDKCQTITPDPEVLTPNSPADHPAPVTPAEPAMTVKKVTTAERKAAAKSGTLTISVTTNSPGTITSVATASVSKRTTKVASKKTTVTGPTTVKVKLALSKAAKSQLKSARKLSVSVNVQHSRVAIHQIQTVRLEQAKPAKKKKTTKRKAGGRR